MKFYSWACWLVFLIGTFNTAKAFSLERVLMIVSELDHRGVPELAPLYKKIEDIAVSLPFQTPKLEEIYHRIHSLRDEQVTGAEFRRQLLEFMNDPQVEQVDVIMGVHGRPGILSFYDGPVSVKEWVDSFLNPSTETHGIFKKLGFLYNLSCFGETHGLEFLRLGFKVVVGSRKVNANAELEYPWVLRALASGYSVTEAFRYPNSPLWLGASDKAIRWIGRWSESFLRETDSFKVIFGDGGWRMRVRPPWLGD